MTPREFRPLAAWIAWAVPIWRRVRERLRVEALLFGRPPVVRKATRECLRRFRRDPALASTAIPVSFPDHGVGLAVAHRSGSHVNIMFEELGPVTTVFETKINLALPVRLVVGPEPELAGFDGER